MATKPKFSKREIDSVLHWQRNPRDWFAAVWPEETLTVQQGDYFDELGKLIGAKLDLAEGKALTEEQKGYVKKIGISVMSGNGTGKDFVTAVTILFFLYCFANPKIPCTAPSAHQLKDIVWAELAKWIRKSRKLDDSGVPLLEKLLGWQAETVFLREKKGKEWFAVARSINTKATPDEQAETLAGFHEDFMLFVVDEASGVPDPVFRPIEGSLTGKLNIVVLIFNPTRTGGYAVKTHGEDASRWVCLRWNAEECERVTREHIEYYRDKFGEDSNTYRIRILGLPPIVDGNTLIPPDWIHDAKLRDIEPDPRDYIVKGFDIGGGGDPSIIATRKGGKVYPFKTNTTADSNVLTDWAYMDFVNAEANLLYGDVKGIGWAIMGNLRKRLSGKVRSVDANSTPLAKERFLNKRMEMAWNVRTAFENKEISIPDDPELIDELLALKTVPDDDTARGLQQLVKKKQIRAELGRSTNKYDALAMTYAYPNMEMRYEDKDDYDDEVEVRRSASAGDSRSFMRA